MADDFSIWEGFFSYYIAVFELGDYFFPFPSNRTKKSYFYTSDVFSDDEFNWLKKGLAGFLYTILYVMGFLFGGEVVFPGQAH